MFLLAVPALVKIILTLGLILLLSRKLPLYVCLFVGCFVIGLWMDRGVASIAWSIWSETSAAQTVWLAVVIILILVLSGLLRISKQLDRIVSSFQQISPGRRFTLAAMPALIGLLPMPGGALFSAPMVETAIGSDEAEPEVRVAVNYWFRHVWEYWWPLYPGIILAISLFGLESWKLILAQAPLSAGALIGGMVFILSLIPKDEATRQAASGPQIRNFAVEITPIFLVMAVFLGLQGLIELIVILSGVSFSWPKYSSLVIGLVGAIALIIRQNSLDAAQVRESVFDAGILPMIMIVFAIMSFKGVLVDSRAIEQVRLELAAYHIPPLVIIALLPFVAGLVTGIAIGFVGASFPLVVALLPAGQSPIPYAVLAFGFGYLGMMLSPVHLCFLVTREYFSADLLASYRYLWKPVLFGLVWTIGLVLLYQLFMG